MAATFGGTQTGGGRREGNTWIYDDGSTYQIPAGAGLSQQQVLGMMGDQNAAGQIAKNTYTPSAYGYDPRYDANYARDFWAGQGVPEPQWNTPSSSPAPSPAQAARGGGSGTPGQPAAAPNPYMPSAGTDAMASAITNRVNDNLLKTVMPQVRGAAQAAGQYGSSRQGVLESNAVSDSSRQLADALASMYLADKGQNQSYNLGMGQLQLGNRQTDINGLQVGANLWDRGNTGTGNIGGGIAALGDKELQALRDLFGFATNNLSPYTGLGASTVGTSSQGGGLMGALGGVYGGLNMAALLAKLAKEGA